MTQPTAERPPTGFETRLAAAAVERAAAEMRRGLPVALAGPKAAALILAAETAHQDALTAIRAWSGQGICLVLSHQRAATLRIPLYTPGAVVLAMPDTGAAEFSRVIADPARDLDAPLKGPFAPARSLPSWPAPESLTLAKLAGLLPATIGTELPFASAEVPVWAAARNIVALSTADLARHDAGSAEIHEVTRARLPLAQTEDCDVVVFRSAAGGPDNLALIFGRPVLSEPVLVRVHSQCFTGDLLASLKCDCGDQLRGAIRAIAAEGAGALLYLAQEGRGIGLVNKLRAYALQDQGFDTLEANERLGFAVDERDFRGAAAMLRCLGMNRIRLLTNNPRKTAALEAAGIIVTEQVPHRFAANPHNARYLAAKADKGGHRL